MEMDAMTLSPFERAAENACSIFQRLDADDRRALHVRLLAIGALNAGDIDFIEQIADDARQTVVDFIRQRTEDRSRQTIGAPV
jgi:hypothetical protein